MRKRRDRWAAAGALAAVVAVLALGFHFLGPRAHQRDIRADERRIEDLRSIAQTLYARQTPLPDRLGALSQLPAVNLKDPLTGAPYEYRTGAGKAYELCATFAADSVSGEEVFRPLTGAWRHPRGRHCFSLNAGQAPPPY